MKNQLKTACYCMLLLLMISQSATAQDVRPTPQVVSDAMWGYQTPLNYQILPRPATTKHRENENTYRPAPTSIQSKPMEPYAYGWFGTKPSPHWHRQFGFQKSYTQWSLK